MFGAGIRLPADAYRPTWFASRLGEGGHFADLLRALAPERWARVRRRGAADKLAFFHELLSYLGTLFPVYEPWLEEIEEWVLADDEEEDLTAEQMDERVYDNLLDHGIPVRVQGFDVYSAHYSAGSPATAAAWFMVHEPWHDEAGREWPAALQKHRALLEPAARLRPGRKPAPPRGRAWAGAWEGLPDLVEWINGETGFLFLDLSGDDVDQNPWWYLEEIHGLAEQWRQAGPVLARIERLTSYVDARPRERLPLLAEALVGDPAALRKVTQPAPRPKTLAEIFASERQPV